MRPVFVGQDQCQASQQMAGGRRVIFAILVNHHTLANRTTVAAIDSLVGDIARGLERRR